MSTFQFNVNVLMLIGVLSNVMRVHGFNMKATNFGRRFDIRSATCRQTVSFSLNRLVVHSVYVYHDSVWFLYLICNEIREVANYLW